MYWCKLVNINSLDQPNAYRTKKENLSLTEANPMHIILNPGKSKGASSDRNKAGIRI